jgi:hypothetical protein
MHTDDETFNTPSGTQNSGSLIKLLLKVKACPVKLWQFIPDVKLLQMSTRGISWGVKAARA